ncbi:MAG: glycosyltransferase family 4 protein [Candidatus Parcubacteria bacterium]|nr:glycosyltransferase family 4 protein [Candidatus Parcubacteria bacterium]
MSASIITFANLGRKQNLRTTDMLPLIEAFAASGELRQIICQINAGFPFKHTYSAIPTWLRYPMRALEKVSGKAFPRPMIERLFDFFTAHRLVRTDVTLMHGGFTMPTTVRRAHVLGSLAVDISVSADLATNVALEKEELPYLGFPEYEGTYTRLAREATHLNFFDYLIVMSDFTRQTHIAAGYPADHIYMAHLDIDTARFAPQARANGAPFRVLYLAHTQPLKGLHYLLDAWESLDLPGAELVIIGGFGEMPEELKQRYINRIQSNPRIKWTAGTHTPEQYYHDASVLVFPSLTEGFGRVTIEAMACGLPVITTDHAPGIVENGKTGFVVPVRDAQAIKEKIEYLYHHRNIAEEMGREARKAVEQKKPFGEEMLEIYRDIMQREGRNSP